MTELAGQDRVVAITGTSRGIGRAVAIELARRGYSVACLSRGGSVPEEDGLDEATRRRLIPYACDMLDENTIRDALAAVVKQQGPLYCLLNNAGFHAATDSHAVPTEEWDKVLDTNLRGAFIASREAYPHFIAAGGGLIINMGSFFDKLGTPRNAAYAASKAGLGALTRVLAAEWGKLGIRVINIAPGFVETDVNREFMRKPKIAEHLARSIPVGQPSQPIEVARLIGALLGEDLPSLTGETIYIDGGQGMAN